jgi:hypothetical protein
VEGDYFKRNILSLNLNILYLYSVIRFWKKNRRRGENNKECGTGKGEWMSSGI